MLILCAVSVHTCMHVALPCICVSGVFAGIFVYFFMTEWIQLADTTLTLPVHLLITYNQIF